MGNLYAFVGPAGSTHLVLVQLDQALQDALGQYFDIYEEQFLNGVDEYIGFDGGYSPDPNQLLQMPLTQEMQTFIAEMDLGAVGREVYDPDQIAIEDLRALAWFKNENGSSRVLLQNFTRGQAISRKIAIMFTGETFRRLEEPSIIIGNHLDGIIRNGNFHFRSFNIAKRIFDLHEVYREATDNDIQNFAANGNILIQDMDAFLTKANATQRKLIFSVQTSGVLTQKTAHEINALAQGMDIDIPLDNGRISLTHGASLTNILKFLDNSLYRSPINQQRYIANSRRRIG